MTFETPKATECNTHVDRVMSQASENAWCPIATRTRLHTVTAGTSKSYVTHLIEDGFDALFVQQQVGHEYASTTAIYTSVSSDYKTRVLRAALDGAIDKAKRTGADR